MSNLEHPDHDPATERIIERHPGPAQQGEAPLHGDDLPGDTAPEDVEGEVGAEGGSDSSRTPTPFHSHEDDHSALGDTDQHSNA